MLRREFNIGAVLACTTAAGWAASQPPGNGDDARWRAIEASVHGRLGVALFDTASGRVTGWRLDERFPMCSTFKWLLAAAVLRRVDAGQDALDRRIVFTRDKLPGYSPSTQQHVGGTGMSVGELCEAAVTLSDNGAANLLLARMGGPSAVTDIARALGDDATRLDRNEPELNEARPGDARDTTTPRGMAAAMRGALTGTVLSAAAQALLTRWLVATQTGAHRVRAGLPSDWRAGDKTGTGDRGSTNDVVIAWPPGRAPVVVVAYLTECEAPMAAREAALAEVGREAARYVAAQTPRPKAS